MRQHAPSEVLDVATAKPSADRCCTDEISDDVVWQRIARAIKQNPDWR